MNEILESKKYEMLVVDIENAVANAKDSIAASVNQVMVKTYWSIGRYIVEYEQVGSVKAEYGKQLLRQLSKDLTLRLGRGYSHSNLSNMRKFYNYYPTFQTVSGKLSWSHICEIIRLDDPLERSFYQKQAENEKWSVRTLQRQIKSSLFLRLAASKDKDGILALAKEGMKIQTPEDIIKDTYTLEFLNISDEYEYAESELENKIIANLQKFLLELGKGFAFVGRQYPIVISGRHYRCDLVFYHRILKCFVLIDLKITPLQHEDVGQMNTYMGYFALEENMPDDNPPIGIILSRNKDELLVEYATYGMDTNLFVSKYELYLPNRDELKRLVDQIINS
ncbi:MAG: PDDEXK nuclease domain-containing protein [Clostridium sp.]|nr:PDDEXK nuclease domain-containing protein [Clostridium sp.]